MKKADILFEIIIKSPFHTTSSKEISIVPHALRPEVYTESLETKNIDFIVEIMAHHIKSYPELHVVPNPAQSEANLLFNLDEAGKTVIRFFEANGCLLYEIEKEFLAGAQKEKIPFDQFPAYQGMIYCQVITNQDTRTAKFMKW